MLAGLAEHLRAGQHLLADQVDQAVAELVKEDISAEAKADFLTALAVKGESAEEITAFALALRRRSVPVPLGPAARAAGVLDVCGTGGDRAHTFNISTTVAFIAAAAGVTVAKHGNRAITSRSGSADVLEALGVAVELSPDQAAQGMTDCGFAFLFAPRFHPAFRQIAPARRLCAERGQRTIFNFLGPLLNPALPDCQLMGVPRPDWCAPLATVLQGMGLRRGMVVCGQVPPEDSAGAPRYLDELSTLGDNTIAEFYQAHGFSRSNLSPLAFAIQSATLAELAGDDATANARLTREILAGRDRGPRRDMVQLNAAAALWVADRVRSLAEGWEMAGALIDDGKAQERLHAVQAFSRALRS